ncbi:MAG TPA: F0F1 ATP synthase subunit B' [Xanthobacteraceae bacterium]|nr:F0F1 ATP synthase subunit B' [Xanthobacteraceae bacterium]
MATAQTLAQQPTVAQTEAPSGAKGTFPPFRQETFASQAIWLILTFVLLYVLMAKLGLPRVGGILENRQNRIEGDLAAAEQAKAAADAAIASYEKSLADARARAQAMAAETQQQQHDAVEAQRKTLEQQLNARIAAAEATIATTRANAMANVKTIATDAAAAIVEQLSGVTPQPGEVDAAVAEATKG